MRKSKFSEEQIVFILHQAEGGERWRFDGHSMGSDSILVAGTRAGATGEISSSAVSRRSLECRRTAPSLPVWELGAVRITPFLQ